MVCHLRADIRDRFFQMICLARDVVPHRRSWSGRTSAAYHFSDPLLRREEVAFRTAYLFGMDGLLIQNLSVRISVVYHCSDRHHLRHEEVAFRMAYLFGMDGLMNRSLNDRTCEVFH